MLENSSNLSKEHKICLHTQKKCVSYSFALFKKRSRCRHSTQGKERAMGRGLPGLNIFPVFHKLGEGIVRNRDMTTGFEG